MSKKRVGVVGIVVHDRKDRAPRVNEILTQYGDIIVGRMGIPYAERGVNVISLIVDGAISEIGAMTGKLGMIEGVTVRSAMAKENE